MNESSLQMSSSLVILSSECFLIFLIIRQSKNISPKVYFGMSTSQKFAKNFKPFLFGGRGVRRRPICKGVEETWIPCKWGGFEPLKFKLSTPPLVQGCLFTLASSKRCPSFASSQPTRSPNNQSHHCILTFKEFGWRFWKLRTVQTITSINQMPVDQVHPPPPFWKKWRYHHSTYHQQ